VRDQRMNNIAPRFYELIGPAIFWDRHRWLTSAILATQIRRIAVLKLAQANSLWNLISKKIRAKMDWRCGSGSTMPALQVRIPEFKRESSLPPQKNVLE
jgi:hypothetical protein